MISVQALHLEFNVHAEKPKWISAETYLRDNSLDHQCYHATVLQKHESCAGQRQTWRLTRINLQQLYLPGQTWRQFPHNPSAALSDDNTRIILPQFCLPGQTWRPYLHKLTKVLSTWDTCNLTCFVLFSPIIWICFPSFWGRHVYLHTCGTYQQMSWSSNIFYGIRYRVYTTFIF